MKYTSIVLSFWEVHTKYTKSILKVYCISAREALRHVRSFYDTIGYKGVFTLAVDATAVVPTMRVKVNKTI